VENFWERHNIAWNSPLPPPSFALPLEHAKNPGRRTLDGSPAVVNSLIEVERSLPFLIARCLFSGAS
jgi:hypothetical protein